MVASRMLSKGYTTALTASGSDLRLARLGGADS
jgi:hypothetical protein